MNDILNIPDAIEIRAYDNSKLVEISVNWRIHKAPIIDLVLRNAKFESIVLVYKLEEESEIRESLIKDRLDNFINQITGYKERRIIDLYDNQILKI